MQYIPSKSPILKLWKILGGNNLGKWLVSKVICYKAPYFSTIKPLLVTVNPGYVELKFKKRRAVLNHIKTIHAIAMCNAAELAGGTCLDVSLSSTMRWIPIAMQVQYLKKATTDLIAKCRIDNYQWNQAQDVVIPVSIYNTSNEKVLAAEITMRLSQKK